jgi:hypothetical protein
MTSTRWLSFRLIALATILMVLGIGAVGCNLPRPCDLGNDSSGIPRCPLSASYLDQRPVGHLAYPGSKVISRQAGGEEVNWDGNSDAFVESTLTVDASPTAIRDWYASKFQQIGWRIPPLDPSGWTPVNGASGPRRKFVTHVRQPEDLRCRSSDTGGHEGGCGFP